MKLNIFKYFLILISTFSTSYIQAENSDSLNIGSLTALTGNAATQGVACKDAFQISIASHKKTNDLPTPINLITGDSQRSAAPAVSELMQMLATKNILGVAFEGSPVGMAINPISNKKQIPIVGIVGHKDFTLLNEFAFGIWPSTEAEGHAIGEALLRSKFSKIAIISVQHEYTLAVRDSSINTISNSPADVISNIEIHPGEIDFSSVLLKIRNKKPDVIFANVGYGNSGLLIKKIRELGIDSTIYANFFASTKGEIESAGPAAEGIINSQVDFDKSKISELYKKFGYHDVEPTTITYSCLASMEFIIQSIESSKVKISTSKDLYEALLRQENIKVLDEIIPIKDRRAIFKFRNQIYKSGKWEPLTY